MEKDKTPTMFNLRGRSTTIILLVLLLFAPTIRAFAETPQSQTQKLGLTGSFVISAICKDGIIIASDSRGNIFDKTDMQQNPIAYFDTVQKVFPIGPNAIAQTGRGLIFNVFFPAIIKNFAATGSNTQVDKLLPAFIDYCKRQYPYEFVEEIRRQKLFAAGYINNSATICYFNEEQPEGRFGCIKGSGLIESAPTLFSKYKTKFASMPFKQAAASAKKAIQAYAKEGNRWKTIGGRISVLLITKTSTRWIENEPPLQRWTYLQEFANEYFQGKVDIHLIPPATKQELDNLMATVPEPK